MSTLGGTIRQSFMRYDTASYTFTTAWALGPTFAIMTGLKPWSKLKIYYNAPCRNDSDSWGGMYTELQASVNGGSWISLGSSGYDGGIMHEGAGSIATYTNTLLIDLEVPVEWSVQFRMYLRSYDGTSYLNVSHDLGGVSGTAPYDSDSDHYYQHYCHILVDEFAA